MASEAPGAGFPHNMGLGAFLGGRPEGAESSKPATGRGRGGEGGAAAAAPGRPGRAPQAPRLRGSRDGAGKGEVAGEGGGGEEAAGVESRGGWRRLCAPARVGRSPVRSARRGAGVARLRSRRPETLEGRPAIGQRGAARRAARARGRRGRRSWGWDGARAGAERWGWGCGWGCGWWGERGAGPASPGLAPARPPPRCREGCVPPASAVAARRRARSPPAISTRSRFVSASPHRRRL